MKRFRIRQYGQSEWTVVSLDGDDLDTIEMICASLLLWNNVRHVQEWNGKGWEDLV